MRKIFTTLALALLMLTSCSTNEPTGNVDDTEEVLGTEQAEGAETDTNSEAGTDLEISDTFKALLEEVNANHEAIETYDGEYASYIEQYKQREDPDSDFFSLCNYRPEAGPEDDVVLTLQQVTEDMEIYYRGLRAYYGCYDYFGGDEAFRPAIDAVIADCAALEVITCGDLRDSLEKHFSFVKDAHFAMSSRRANEYQVPFFFRDVVYEKTENGYEAQDGRIVSSVEGYSNLDDLFKLSLTKEGDLVYYPIILQGCTYVALITEEIPCDTVLTVHYTDGSYDTLTAQPYRLDSDTEGQADVSVQENEGIPMITINHFSYQTGFNLLLNTSVDYRDSDLLMIDLRECMGGNANMFKLWFPNYVQQPISPNALYLALGAPDHEIEYLGRNEDFVASDNILIILTSKLVASCGEIFIDTAHNLENSLVIGENTLGCNVGASTEFTLPNSELYMSFGPALTLHSEGENFEEYIGYYPDIWVPAAEAEEAVMNFIQKNTNSDTYS